MPVQDADPIMACLFDAAERAFDEPRRACGETQFCCCEQSSAAAAELCAAARQQSMPFSGGDVFSVVYSLESVRDIWRHTLARMTPLLSKPLSQSAIVHTQVVASSPALELEHVFSKEHVIQFVKTTLLEGCSPPCLRAAPNDSAAAFLASLAPQAHQTAREFTPDGLLLLLHGFVHYTTRQPFLRLAFKHSTVLGALARTFLGFARNYQPRDVIAHVNLATVLVVVLEWVEETVPRLTKRATSRFRLFQPVPTQDPTLEYQGFVILEHGCDYGARCLLFSSSQISLCCSSCPASYGTSCGACSGLYHVNCMIERSQSCERVLPTDEVALFWDPEQRHVCCPGCVRSVGPAIYLPLVGWRVLTILLSANQINAQLEQMRSPLLL